ncbi:MAG TPA: histidine phosphatase family protein [Pyrinomonadaceae bacterium]|nr:histidine phosphatase family protein [Pyrinomonadaceae bacterium]
MRTLYLLRHAKSSWKDESLSDFERPLKRRGREAAQLAGERLAQEKLKNPVLICSPAVRTRETAELVLKSSKLRVEERWDERIYEASLRDLLQVVSEIPDDKKVAILIGHNPGFEELLAFLTGESRRMPTAALAKIMFDVSWKDIEARSGKLDWFVTPKELAEE